MPIIYVNSTAGAISNSNSVYNTARNAPTGDSVSVWPTATFLGQREHLSSYQVKRGYMAFDTSAITSVPITATINLYVTSSSNANYYIQDSMAPDLTTDIATTDFDAYGPNGPYTSLISVTGDGWMSIPLNTSGRNALNTLSIFKIMILASGDYHNIPPDAETEYFDTFDFSLNDPYISYTEGTPGEIFSINKTSINLLSNINNINT